MADERFELRQMYNRESVGALAAAVHQGYPAFDREGFLARVFDAAWEARALKDRMRHITTALHAFLPPEYRTALAVLREVAPRLGDYGFEKMVFSDFVAVYGLEDWEASIPALEEFTRLVSAEFAVRPFIRRYPERMMAQMLAWAHHEAASVRRLASEGCRPRLPWGMGLPALKKDPAPILPILDRLKDDPDESVRRSVANNLNDMAKDHPEVVIDRLRRWQVDNTPHTRWITTHALRTLVKQGHPGALALLGYGDEPLVAVRSLRIEPAVVPMGGATRFSFEVVSLAGEPQELVIDYVVYFMKANGKQAPKVFKLARRTLGPGDVLPLARTIDFRPITTRTYYPGEHAVAPQINGRQFGSVARFLLRETP